MSSSVEVINRRLTGSKSNISRSGSRGRIRGLQQAVGDVLERYSEINPYLKASDDVLPQADVNVPKKVMKSEKVFSSEENAKLWSRALVTSLDDISCCYYPHHLVVQKLINYTLTSSCLDVGLITAFFTKLMLYHGPDTLMQNYYWSLLNGQYIQLKTCNRERNAFWSLIEALLTCLENSFNLKLCQEKKKNEKKVLHDVMNLEKLTSNDDLILTLTLDKNSDVSFDALPYSDKFERVLIVLNFFYNILEGDFVNHCQKCGFYKKEEKRTFLSELLWPDTDGVGVVNDEVRKLIDVYRLMEEVENQWQRVHLKLITLLAEVVRQADMATTRTYPYLGRFSDSLARDLSLKFFGAVKDKPDQTMASIRAIKPHSLRLLVCTKILGLITGRACSPELTTVTNILDLVTSLKKKRCGNTRGKKGRRRNSSYQAMELTDESMNPGSCFSGCSSVRAGGSGRRERLSFDVDINAVDDQGWTALHKAVLNRHFECVSALLNYRPGYGKRKKPANTRLKGYMGFTPLMCAVLKNEPEISKLLLELSGPALLEDVNITGQTAKDLCQSEEVGLVLDNFRGKNPPEGQSKSDGDEGNVDVIIDLCVQIVESYLMTHRTLDVAKRLKGSDSGVPKRKFSGKSIEWDRSRYQADFNKNISQLTVSIAKLRSFKDGKCSWNYLIPFLKVAENV